MAETVVPYSGPERRADPKNSKGVDWHAARALGRRNADGSLEFPNLDPEARRRDISQAGFRNEGAYVGEAEKIRRVMLRDLDQIEGRRTPEQAELLGVLEGQYDRSLAVWREKFPTDVKNAPSRKVVSDWLASLSPQTLNGILEFKDTARLVMVPPLPVPELLNLLDGNKTISGQKDSKVWWPEGWNGVQASAWKFGITDGIEDMPFNPEIFYNNPAAESDPRTNEQMVAEYRARFGAKGLGIMPQDAYVPAMASALAERKVLDKANITYFERPVGADRLPVGDWNDGRVRLGGGNPEDSLEGLRCRPWVEGR